MSVESPATIAPSWLLALFEAPRAIAEATSLIPANSMLNGLAPGDGHTVMTLPGFLATDRSTRILRRYLDAWGYDAKSWKLGRNLGPSFERNIEALLDDRLVRLFRRSRGKVSLVGWSLGGLFAHEMARRHPDMVRSVITLGSPLGNPRATNAWRLFEYVSGMDIDGEAIQQRIEVVRTPIQGVPVTAIYSKSDAVVSWQIAKLPAGDLVENVGIAASHFGMGFNPAVLYVIADRLRQSADSWQPFRISGFRNLFYH